MRHAIPDGYFKTPHRLTEHQAQLLMHQWKDHREAVERGMPSVMVLSEGLEFVPFQTPATPDAICMYCMTPNYTSSLWCAGCGAPLVRQQ